MKLELKMAPLKAAEESLAQSPPHRTAVDLKIDDKVGQLVQAITINVNAQTMVPTAHMQFIPEELSLDLELDQQHITTDLSNYAQSLAVFSRRLLMAPELAKMPGYADLLRAAQGFARVLAEAQSQS